MDRYGARLDGGTHVQGGELHVRDSGAHVWDSWLRVYRRLSVRTRWFGTSRMASS